MASLSASYANQQAGNPHDPRDPSDPRDATQAHTTPDTDASREQCEPNMMCAKLPTASG